MSHQHRNSGAAIKSRSADIRSAPARGVKSALGATTDPPNALTLHAGSVRQAARNTGRQVRPWTMIENATTANVTTTIGWRHG